jgi:uncharacterized membrane protein
MEAFLLDSLNLLLRWLHIITGIAWIGASFYFVMLDTSLRKPKKDADEARGVHGELWAVHGGGFYHSQKFLTGPKGEPLSNNLHWSKWEAYSTWLSGISLLILMYWFNAELYLIDPFVMELSKSAAILISAGFIVGGWLIYDFLCKSPLAKNENLLAGIIFVLCAIAAWGLSQLFSGRGAYIMFGAMLGTTMVANVFFIIIPGQKKMVEAIRAGQPVDPKPGVMGKQRSVHNTYFTLPVLFTMISNHYAATYGHEYNWLILIGLSLAGALIRVFFVSRHGEGKPNRAALGIALVILVGVFALMAPKPSEQTSTANAETVSFEQVQTIMEQRCMGCHAVSPEGFGFTAAPKGIVLETQAQIEAQAAAIHQQTVVAKAMPIGNLTAMTEEERALIDLWYQQLQSK